ncbi:MAG: response regulator [Deltaproteobacteria bacterium]|nr:response regulator [Deltaproteobacteria bacterium]MBN2670706.1 response regulator [Deltaproteobacteria bacterium]
MRILIIDDDYISRTQIKALMLGYGDCDIAPNGEIGLMLFDAAHCEDVPYNLITVDVDMPGLSGTDVVKEIRSREDKRSASTNQTEAKVIMVSAMDDGKNIMASFRKGAEGYLVKPITPDKIKKTFDDIELMK